MHEIVIQLSPERLSNPDLDLRYVIPDTLSEIADGDLEVQDNGYDYSELGNSLNLFLLVSDVAAFATQTTDYLAKNKLFGNDVLPACKIVWIKGANQFTVLHSYDNEPFAL